MQELFIEIYSEEIPARMQKWAAEQFKAIFKERLVALIGDSDGSKVGIQTYVTPCRLVLRALNLPESIPAINEEIRGPKVDAPAAAVAGFKNKYGIKLDAAEEKDRSGSVLQERDGYLFYILNKPSQPFAEVLSGLLNKIFEEFTWPKSMRWGDVTQLWVRPIKSIILMLNNQVIPFEYAKVESENFTYGHKFFGSGKKLEVESFDAYEHALAENFVCLDPAKRMTMILADARECAKNLGYSLIDDEALFEEVTGLTEYPTVLCGKIAEEFLALPKEVLISTIRSHQKYLMMEADDGSLAPYFLIIADGKYEDESIIIKGNEKVLRARLSDAKFFYQNDCSTKLLEKLEKLKNLTFHTEIGSMYDKVQRIVKIAKKITEILGNLDSKVIEESALLAKCDLVSEIVYELPELQGIMGYYYALNDGLDEAVALAVRDHYKPQGPNDSLPINIEGAIVALADKIDTLQELFAIGIKPTGSKDPYAQRRAALGILRIINDYKLHLPLSDIIKDQSLLDFILERMKISLSNKKSLSEIEKVVEKIIILRYTFIVE